MARPVTSSRWTILTAIYLCMLSYTFALQSIPPVLSLIIEQLRLSHHQAGILMSLFALPGIVVSLPAGMLADYYGIKRVAVVSFLLTIVGTVMVATGETFTSLVAGRAAAGVGAISLIVIAPQGIAQWFKHSGIGVAMGIYNTALPVGVIVCLNSLPPLASRWGWRSGTWVVAGFIVSALVIFSLCFQETTEEARKIRPSNPELGKKTGVIGLVALSWALFSASVISLYTFAPAFMVSRGLSLESAGFDTSLVVAGPLCLSPIVGYVVDRIGQREIFIAAGGLGMALLLPLVPGSNHLALLMVVIGISAALIPAPIYSLAAHVVSQRRLGFGFGLLSMFYNTGIFIGPQLVGLSRDVCGSYRVGFGLMALFAILSTVAAVILWAKGGRQNTSFHS